MKEIRGSYGVAKVFTDNIEDKAVEQINEYKTKQIKEAFKSAQNKSISVIRKTGIEINLADICVGDQIKVSLKYIGDFTATVHKVTDKEVLFIMDEYIASKPMNGLQEWLDTVVYDAFPDDLKKKIKNITIPSVGQVFGWEDEWLKKVFERDSDEQLPLMKQRRNRVAYLDNEIEWGWLRNHTKSEVSSAYFACVSSGGGAVYLIASSSLGVRPEFTLVK